MRAVAVVRHGSAGDRAAHRGDDALRPLDARGLREAEAIADVLAGRMPLRILTSPAVRCIQTVAPLSQRTGVPAERVAALAEGADPQPASLISSEGPLLVLCSHGDVIGRLIGFGRPARKGSVWMCEWDGSELRPATYLRKPRA